MADKINSQSVVEKMIDPMTPILFKIESIRQELRDTFTLFLTPADSKTANPEYSFLPGQFNMLYSFGAGEVPISVSGSPSLKGSIIHTIRSVGGVTQNLQGLKVGDLVGVRGPYGRPWPMDLATGRDVLIIAGGLGLAPLRPAIYQILEHRNQYGKVTLLYGGRSPEELLFVDELNKWSQTSQIDVLLTVDKPTFNWSGRVGVVPSLISNIKLNPQNTVAMICGPEVMMRFSAPPLLKLGLSPKNIFVSMERNMKCAVGFCGRCQYREFFTCKDGPVFSWEQIHQHIEKREL